MGRGTESPGRPWSHLYLGHWQGSGDARLSASGLLLPSSFMGFHPNMRSTETFPCQIWRPGGENGSSGPSGSSHPGRAGVGEAKLPNGRIPSGPEVLGPFLPRQERRKVVCPRSGQQCRRGETRGIRLVGWASGAKGPSLSSQRGRPTGG